MSRLSHFVAADTGIWHIKEIKAITGETLPAANYLSVYTPDQIADVKNARWNLRGITSNERYVSKAEKALLVSKQEGLGRPQATCAALIPIRKKATWWAMTQEERRDIFEAQSHHIEIGLMYLPAIARRLHHCRDLSEQEPFDFLTWFEFAPQNAQLFQDMLGKLRQIPEWNYIDREVEILVEKQH